MISEYPLRWAFAFSALVYASGLQAQSAFLGFEGTQNGDLLGDAVTSAGDVDGDGYADIVLGSPGYTPTTPASHSHAGRVLIHSGRTGVLVTEILGSLDHQNVGFAVESIGDVDLDGTPDLAVGEPGYRITTIFNQTLYGGVRVHSGATGTMIYFKVGVIGDDARLGHVIEAMGDLDFDGYPEFAIGAPFLDSPLGKSDAGGVVLVNGKPGLGTPGPTISELTLEKAGAHYGWSIARLGPNRILIGAPSYDTASPDVGYVDIRDVLGNTISIFSTPTLDGMRLGSSLAALGDVNGDQFTDFAVGSPGAGLGPLNDAGMIGVYHSVSAGTSWLPVTALSGKLAGEGLGFSVAGAGDVDGDGIPDLLGGGPTSELSSTAGIDDTGIVRLYSGATHAPITTFSAQLPNALSGYSVAGAGDVDGDGRSEVLYGAPAYGGAGGMQGRAFLHLANAVAAKQATYGAGVHGTLGIPGIALSGNPVLCQSSALQIKISSAVAAPGMLFLGVGQAGLPVSAGLLLVASPWITVALMVPAGLTSIPTMIPCDAALNGATLDLQLLLSDGGAPQGVAFTRGLELTFGT